MLMVRKFKASCTVAAVALLTTAATVWSFGLHCPSYRARVTNADTIVVGRTMSVTREEVRPTLYAVTYEFHVDRVLKGDKYKTGDTIVRRYDPNERRFGLQPFPYDDEDAHIVFVNRNEDGTDHFACSALVSDVDLDAITRQIKVEQNPPAFFASDDEQDVITVLDWIRRTNVRYEPHGGSRADWSDKSRPNRETIIRYLLKHARGDRDDLSVAALDVLALIHPPEAFDLFKNALQSTDDGDKIAHAARGFRMLADERAIPLLIDRLKDLRQEDAERSRRWQDGEEVTRLKSRSRGWGVTWSPRNELRVAITSFDDPRVEQFLLASLSEGIGSQMLSYMRQLNDPRAVEPLLRSLWQGNASAIEPLLKYDDDRIAAEARERIYDHPLAPRLLALRGDPSVREFMVRLIRQGFPVGIRWAAAAKDESVKADLVLAFAVYSRAHSFGHRIAYALGRIRAFDVAASILERDFDDRDVTDAWAMLAGLSDRSFGVQDDCRRGEHWNCIRRSLREVAKREQWTSSEVELADELVTTCVNWKNPRTRYHIGSIPVQAWSPPASLLDMPDPLDKEATAKYLKKNVERCRGVLHDGSGEDQSKVLQAARHCGMNILDRDMTVKLLVGSDWRVRNLAHSAVKNGQVELTVSDMERWALTGNFQSTRMAIGYIRRHPKPDYAPIVTKVFLRGRHLFVETLFEAIIETKATGCSDLLRAYLENEHYTLRMNAAITLIHLEDDAGRTIMAELEPYLRNCTECIGGDYRQEALDQLN